MASEAAPALEFRDVSRRYRTGGTSFSISGISFAVPPGSTLMLSGPSGSGKSTLLNLAAGLDRPDSGTVVHHGQDIARLPESARARWRAQHAGIVFQHHLLPGGLRCLEAVAAPLLWSCGLSPGEAKTRARAMLERCGLAGFERQRVQTLSGGQRQRVAIARALAPEPALVLADEPTAQLDHATAGHIADLIREYVREKRATMIVVSHEDQPGEWDAEDVLTLGS